MWRLSRRGGGSVLGVEEGGKGAIGMVELKGLRGERSNYWEMKAVLGRV